MTDHAWLPRNACAAGCVTAGGAPRSAALLAGLRAAGRLSAALVVLPCAVLLALPLPGRSRAQRTYCRLMLRCLGIRITVSGGPIRNLRGVLVVAGHVSWVDIFTVGAVLPGSFVARADLIEWRGLGLLVRLMKVIPIDRASLRRLPGVVGTVAERLRAGQTVIAFPEGTTWCGRAYGRFRPALFQAAVDTGRPVQPLRLSYRHRDGSTSTTAAFIGEDSLWTSIKRVTTARRSEVHVHVASLQLPGSDRRALAARSEAEVRGSASMPESVDGHALAA